MNKSFFTGFIISILYFYLFTFDLTLGEILEDVKKLQQTNFDALPDTAYTIKVGTKNTKARFYAESVDDVRKLLHQISSK